MTTETNERLIGRVKWFNNKQGYGFITITVGERSGQDIFVHHSDISVDTEQYRYLVQGEYVSFTIINLENKQTEHSVQATDVSGVMGGQLMCETHKQQRDRTNSKRPTQRTSQHATRPPTQRRYRQQHNNDVTNFPTTWKMVPDTQQEQRPKRRR